MSTGHLAIIGCGDIGTRVGLQLEACGWHVSALRRRAELLPRVFERFSGDYTCAHDLEPLAAKCPTHVLFTPLPLGRDVSGYERGFAGGVDAMVGAGLLKRASFGIMVSSTRVYAESMGGWVDETSPLTDEDAAGQAIIQAENLWREALVSSTVARASGLYGELPGLLLSRVASGQASHQPERISNRIHRDDVAAALVFLLRATMNAPPPPILLLSDNSPTPIGQVEAWLAQQLGVSLAHNGARSPVPRGNRRCDNRRLRSLGFELRYPSYKEGYQAMLSERTSIG